MSRRKERLKHACRLVPGFFGVSSLTGLEHLLAWAEEQGCDAFVEAHVEEIGVEDGETVYAVVATFERPKDR